MKAFVAVLALGVLLAPEQVHATGRGDHGPQVVEVQTMLADFGYTVTVDGVYGPQTEKAVRSWQRSNGLRVDGIAGPVTVASLRAAVRVGNAHPVGGLNGLPFAPDGLSDCDEMRFYRVQAGLPDVFDGLGWRESNCRNEDGVRTFCCYGYWQNYITSHLSRQSAYRQPIIERCQVSGADDINSDVPLDKQRQACVTAVVYSISGLSPWR
jgi:peptidoglycan hydrolase-like protein with peptidoglycan-binding domain